MIRLKTLLEVQLIKEALPLRTAKMYTNIGKNPEIVSRQNSILDALKQQPGAESSKRGDRVYIPFEPASPYDVAGYTSFSEQLQEFITEFGYYTQKSLRQASSAKRLGIDAPSYPHLDVSSILSGLVHDQYDRKIKISKFIQTVLLQVEIKYTIELLKTKVSSVRHKGKEGYFNSDGAFQSWDDLITKLKKEVTPKIKQLIDQYNSIPEVKEVSTNRRIKPYYIVFSKHAYDVAGMSTDRGWTSCMNLYGGSNAHYISMDVVKGTLVAYLVNVTDKNINKPVARVAIKPFVNINDESDVAYQAEGRAYGSPPADFLKTVDRLIDDAQPGKVGTFKLIDTLYCDSNRLITKFSDPRIADTVDELIRRQLPARTVDEAKYILRKYTDFYTVGYGGEDITFSEADGIWASGMIDINFTQPISYCPIQFDSIHSINVRGISSFKNFPKTLHGYLMLYNLNTPGLNFEGLESKVSQVYVYDSMIQDFKGLPDSTTLIQVRRDQYNTNIKSLQGLPISLTSLMIHDNVNLDMTVHDVVKQLKSLPGLYNLLLPIQEIRELKRKIPTEFHTSMNKLMNHPDLQSDSEQVRFVRILNCIGYEIGVQKFNLMQPNISVIPEDLLQKYLNAIRSN